MAAIKKKTFTVTDPFDLEKVDKWWAGLLSTGAKEIIKVEWAANGDLVWRLTINWSPITDADLPFNVCMPAYSDRTVEDLEDLLDAVSMEKEILSNNIKLFKGKIDDWGISEITLTAEINYEEMSIEDLLSDFMIDPTLTYAPTLDSVDKIMVSEFLWPSYKSMTRRLLMCEAKIAEIEQELEHRNDSSYTVVHVDRGLLRREFKDQLNYDNKWLFASDEEIDSIPEDLTEDP